MLSLVQNCQMDHVRVCRQPAKKSRIHSHPCIRNCVQTLYAYCSLGELDHVIWWLKRHSCILSNVNVNNNNHKCFASDEQDTCHCVLQGNIKMIKERLCANACEHILNAGHFHILYFFIEQGLVDHMTILKKLGNTSLFHWVISNTDDIESIRLYLSLFRGSLYYNHAATLASVKFLNAKEFFTIACKYARHKMIRFLYEEYKEVFDGHFLIRLISNHLFKEKHFVVDPNLSVFRYLFHKLSLIELTSHMQVDLAAMLGQQHCIASRLTSHIEIVVDFMKQYFMAHRHDTKWLKSISGNVDDWHSAWRSLLQRLMIQAVSDKNNQVAILNILTRDKNVCLDQMMVGMTVEERIREGHVDNIVWMLDHNYKLDVHKLLCDACTERRVDVMRHLLPRTNPKDDRNCCKHLLVINLSQRHPKVKGRVLCPAITRCIVQHCPTIFGSVDTDFFIFNRHKEFFIQEFLAQNMEVLENVIRVLDEYHQSQHTTDKTLQDTFSLDLTFALVVLRDIVLRQLHIESHFLSDGRIM
jgi:hypothetical protein